MNHKSEIKPKEEEINEYKTYIVIRTLIQCDINPYRH